MANERAFDLTELREELKRLKSSVAKVESAIEALEGRNRQQIAGVNADRKASPRSDNGNSSFPDVRDRDGTRILVGNCVAFLTRGKFASNTGRVKRISQNGDRIISVDSDGRSIARAPHNVRVIDDK